MAPEARKRYRRRPDRPVVAIRLALDTDGLVYHKWGGQQQAKAGDWVVDNGGDVYTIDAEVFARTYRPLGLGTFVKMTPVWAARAEQAGSIPTKEGVTYYDAGWYLVSNASDGSDAYAISPEKFHELYEPDDGA